MNKYLPLYRENKWFELCEMFKQDVLLYANSGDSVNLTCYLSKLGCCHLFLTNHHEVNVIYEFLIKEYDQRTLTKKEQANVATFLGFYSLFQGNIQQTIVYFEEAKESYRTIDELDEEAIMLINSLRWFYLYMNDQEGIYYIYERLKKISQLGNKTLKEYIAFVLGNYNFFKLPFNEWFWKLLFLNCSKDVNVQYYESIPYKFLDVYHAFTQQHTDNIREKVFTLKAQVDQFKHPWFKAFAYFFVGSVLNRENDKNEAKTFFNQIQIDYPLNALDLSIDFSLPSKENYRVNTNKFSFHLFQSFKIIYGNCDISIGKWKRKQAEEILIFLLFQHDLQIPKEVIIEEFYPNEQYNKALNRLYVNLHEINHFICKTNGIDQQFISLVNGFVKINRDLVDEIDVQIFLKLNSVGNQLWFEDRAAAIELFEKAVGLFDIQLVPHLLYSTWLEAYRENILDQHVKLIEKLLYYYKNSEQEEKYLVKLYNCKRYDENVIKQYALFLVQQNRNLEAEAFLQRATKVVQEEIGIDLSNNLNSILK